MTPLDPPYDPEIAKALERMMGGSGIEPLKLFRTVARNPHVLDKFRSMGSYLLNFGTLNPTDREIVVLRTCALNGSAYEWGVHVAVYSEAVGLNEAQVAATVSGETDAWDEQHVLLVRMAEELHRSSGITDDLWNALAVHWSDAQLVELLAVAGQYRMVCYFTNALRIETESFAAPMLSAAPATP